MIQTYWPIINIVCTVVVALVAFLFRTVWSDVKSLRETTNKHQEVLIGIERDLALLADVKSLRETINRHQESLIGIERDLASLAEVKSLRETTNKHQEALVGIERDLKLLADVKSLRETTNRHQEALVGIERDLNSLAEVKLLRETLATHQSQLAVLSDQMSSIKRDLLLEKVAELSPLIQNTMRSSAIVHQVAELLMDAHLIPESRVPAGIAPVNSTMRPTKPQAESSRAPDTLSAAAGGRQEEPSAEMVALDRSGSDGSHKLNS